MPHHHNHGQNREQDLKHDINNEIKHVIHFAVAGTGAGDKPGNHAGQEIDKGVHQPLQQGGGDHIAIGYVAHFMRQYGFQFAVGHGHGQSGRDCNHRFVAGWACGEGIGCIIPVYPHFRHFDAGLLCQFPNRVVDQLLFLRGRVDNLLHFVHAFGHRFGHPQ